MRWIFVFFILGVILFVGSSFLIKPKVVEISSLPNQVSEPEIIENKTVAVILVGDIMLDRGVEYMVEKEGNGNFKFPFLKIADELKMADIIFGNLEGPISDKGTMVGSIYSFRNDPKAIVGLTFAGFNILSLANNHTFDYGREALEDTFLRLNDADIKYVGAGLNEGEVFSPVIKKIGNTEIGFLAYTNLGPESWKAGEKNSGIAWISEKEINKIKEDIKNTKERTDILIVSLHSGEEYQKEPTQFQVEFSKMAIDAGADLVIGHHPHVVQKSEKYKNGWIFYSSGNFVFDQNFSEETMEGQIVKVLIEDKKIKEVAPINIKINEFFQPEIKKSTTVKISLSSQRLKQADTLLVKVEGSSLDEKISGEFDSKEIDFLKLVDLDGWVGIIGIDVKKKPAKYNLIIRVPNEDEAKKEIEIIKRNFPITKLLVTEELEEKGYTPQKIVEDITTKENLILKEVLGIYTKKAYFDKAFIYPLREIKVVGAYGNIRENENLAIQHLGVDLEADIGIPVYAVNDGVVRFSQELTNYGKTLIIDHGLGIFSLYLHLNEFKVLDGKEVKRGEIVGLSGSTGYSISPHLHFSIKANGASVDPLRFIETTKKELTK